MKSAAAMHAAPRCTATSKRTRLPCQAPAVTGWTVCRFHGARGGGPKGARKLHLDILGLKGEKLAEWEVTENELSDK